MNDDVCISTPRDGKQEYMLVLPDGYYGIGRVGHKAGPRLVCETASAYAKERIRGNGIRKRTWQSGNRLRRPGKPTNLLSLVIRAANVYTENENAPVRSLEISAVIGQKLTTLQL
jgi:hypothetical protein